MQTCRPLPQWRSPGEQQPRIDLSELCHQQKLKYEEAVAYNSKWGRASIKKANDDANKRNLKIYARAPNTAAPKPFQWYRSSDTARSVVTAHQRLKDCYCAVQDLDSNY
ncbi:hypothetical protein EMPS_01997 [Entomortierella parvispora]|uniref:Uncharacterized protein n=1 Tax=Entomortierella parvispora TaxID=205924 RepID=A0A9P3H417_9FUNG|nr:hypothetical protein EMPS_01997 [Entomortierella parvispora]